jgi:serine/threonine protein kinase
MLLNNKYIVLEHISRGQFGEIVKAKHATNYYAIKMGEKNVIKYESMIYKKLKGVASIPTLYDIFEYNTNICLVLDYYCKTLQNVKEECFENNISYVKQIISYLMELIIIIKDIHNKNVIHRDLKPANICLNSNNKVFLIDFGISKIYKNGTIHNDETKISGLLGSVNFSSLNTINLIEPSRRDDIESVLYILVYMLLPKNTYIVYNELNITEKKNIQVNIDFLKTAYSNIDYNVFTKLFNYIRRLKYNQQPNYEYLLDLISKMIY